MGISNRAIVICTSNCVYKCAINPITDPDPSIVTLSRDKSISFSILLINCHIIVIIHENIKSNLRHILTSEMSVVSITL
jgi:hypothetical protein